MPPDKASVKTHAMKADVHPNWVAERAKCDIGRMFADVCDLVAEDVERMGVITAENEADSTGYTFYRPRNKRNVCIIR